MEDMSMTNKNETVESTMDYLLELLKEEWKESKQEHQLYEFLKDEVEELKSRLLVEAFKLNRILEKGEKELSFEQMVMNTKQVYVLLRVLSKVNAGVQRMGKRGADSCDLCFDPEEWNLVKKVAISLI